MSESLSGRKHRGGDCPDVELELLVSFSEALARGEHPDIAVHLAGHEHLAAKLEPLLETAVWLHEQFAALKRRCPGLRAWHLIGLPAKVRKTPLCRMRGRGKG